MEMALLGGQKVWIQIPVLTSTKGVFLGKSFSPLGPLLPHLQQGVTTDPLWGCCVNQKGGVYIIKR